MFNFGTAKEGCPKASGWRFSEGVDFRDFRRSAGGAVKKLASVQRSRYWPMFRHIGQPIFSGTSVVPPDA